LPHKGLTIVGPSSSCWSSRAASHARLGNRFAAQSIACIDDLGLDVERTNLDGGAIALGHPLGATGARITGKAAELLKRESKQIALASQCIGGGQGKGVASEHDAAVADALAEVLTGGAKADMTEPVTTDRVLTLEREAFMRLVKTDKTLARIEHTLETGKPLRN
jgi:hypothetical protein